jgi:hypothetical protein
MEITAEFLKSLHDCVKRTIVESYGDGVRIAEDHATVWGVSSVGWFPDGTLQLMYEGELWGQKYVVEFRKYPHEEVFRAYVRKPGGQGSPLVLVFTPRLTWGWTFQRQYGEM